MLPNPLPQSDAYANTLRALGTRVRTDAIGHQGRCLIQTRHIPLIGPVNLISRGPVGLAAADEAAYLHSLDLRGPLIVNTNSPETPTDGLIRLSRPKSVALLPLCEPRRMRKTLHPSWRGALNKAEKGDLRITNTAYHPTHHAWLIQAERAQQKSQGYRNWPIRLLDTFARENPGQARVITAQNSDGPIAGMLILCHRPWSTYHIAVTTKAGRAANAHTLMLWKTMIWLQARGYSTLDLGLLTGPDGLDRFKLRTGAHRHHLGGTWLRLLPAFRRQFPSIQMPSGQKA
ncbi:GNAT family N-acetyltransferase [Marivita geojedonensis]|uniref:GNAT family N-acetyltransferase n=1 Tax=Marivita geojedonensis TaxID=1123756 RepID=UPI000A1F46E5|nr:GNAT family N-acetyltransferase [Marivita geojedonensis]PRY81225.1 acetyltransferase (GNAT) family protein [Marivita geojedonensis]